MGILAGCGYPHADQRAANHCINWELHDNGRARIWWDSGSVDFHCHNSDLRQDRWCHVAFVVSAAFDRATIYVDGAEVGSHRATFAQIVPSKPPRVGGDLRDGEGVGLAPQFQVGMVRFWSTVRTAEELKQFADAEAEDVPTDGLMLHYVFDSSEDTDDRVIDHSPSANHARCVAGRRLTWLREGA